MVANVRNPILGSSFPQTLWSGGWHGPQTTRRYQDKTFCSRNYFVSSSWSSNPFTAAAAVQQFHSTAILIEFPTITQLCSKDHPIKHDIMHHIEMTGTPVSARPQRLAPEWLKSTQQEFEHMLELAIIRLPSSNWSSPLHTVTKKSRDGVHEVTIKHHHQARSLCCPSRPGHYSHP